MHSGVTQISGEIIAAKENTFQVMQHNGEPVTVRVPPSMPHMLRGIAVGIQVNVENTLSGPKAIIIYGNAETQNTINSVRDRAGHVARGAVLGGIHTEIVPV